MIFMDLDLPERTRLTAPLETPRSRASRFMRLFAFRTIFICDRVNVSGIVCNVLVVCLLTQSVST